MLAALEPEMLARQFWDAWARPGERWEKQSSAVQERMVKAATAVADHLHGLVVIPPKRKAVQAPPRIVCPKCGDPGTVKFGARLYCEPCRDDMAGYLKSRAV